MRRRNKILKPQGITHPPTAQTTEVFGAHPRGTSQIFHGTQAHSRIILTKHLQPAKPTTPSTRFDDMTPDFPLRQDNTNPGILASEEEEPDLIGEAAVKVT